MKKPLDFLYEGPYEVVERITDRVFKIKVKGELKTVSTERLKPAYQEALPSGDNIQSTPTVQQLLKTYPPAKRKVTFAT